MQARSEESDQLCGVEDALDSVESQEFIHMTNVLTDSSQTRFVCDDILADSVDMLAHLFEILHELVYIDSGATIGFGEGLDFVAFLLIHDHGRLTINVQMLRQIGVGSNLIQFLHEGAESFVAS
jgi:hypothetical protein